MADLPIIIVGAGMGGLTATLGLQRFGYKVVVLETAPELGEVGAGLTVTPNATHALNFLGVGDRVAEFADTPEGGGVKHYRTGEVLVATDRGDEIVKTYGARYYQIHRADMHQILTDAVLANDPDCIKLSHTVEKVTQTDTSITAHCKGGIAVEGDVLVGCDGLRSAVRANLIEEKAPRFTGQVAWRGLVPSDNLTKEMMTPSSAVTIGPGRIFTRYFVRHRKLVNYVAIAEKEDWREEGWAIPSTIEELLNEYQDFHESSRGIIEETPPNLLYKWALFDRDPVEQWTHGRATLLGDAAHPMLPFLGQGAAMAIEDGCVLGRAFGAEADPVAAMHRYEKARRPRANKMLLDSRAQGKNFQGQDPDSYDREKHRSAENPNIFGYNPATCEV